MTPTDEKLIDEVAHIFITPDTDMAMLDLVDRLASRLEQVLSTGPAHDATLGDEPSLRDITEAVQEWIDGRAAVEEGLIAEARSVRDVHLEEGEIDILDLLARIADALQNARKDGSSPGEGGKVEEQITVGVAEFRASCRDLLDKVGHGATVRVTRYDRCIAIVSPVAATLATQSAQLARMAERADIIEALVAESRSNRAAHNLETCQRQLDADGVEVGVSRQAVDETLALVARLEDALSAAARAISEMGG